MGALLIGNLLGLIGGTSFRIKLKYYKFTVAFVRIKGEFIRSCQDVLIFLMHPQSFNHLNCPALARMSLGLLFLF